MRTAIKNPKGKSVKPIPEGFHSVTPFLIVDQAESLIKFIEEAFDGNVTSIMKDENDEKIMHATVQVGDSQIMIADSNEKFAPMPSMLYVYVKDVDSVYQKAVSAKGISLREPTDEFYGDRSAGVTDNWGNQWWIATHTEDVSEPELKKRQETWAEQPHT